MGWHRVGGGLSYGMLPKCQRVRPAVAVCPVLARTSPDSGLVLELWSSTFLAFELSFSRLPFVACHCFRWSIVWNFVDWVELERKRDYAPNCLNQAIVLEPSKGIFFRRVSLFSLVEVLTLTWSMLGCHNSFITVPAPSWLQFTKLTPMLRLLLNAFAKEITHPFYPRPVLSESHPWAAACSLH